MSIICLIPCFYYARILYEESVKADYITGIVYYTVAQGWSYGMKGQKNEALKYYLSALEPAEKDGRPQLLAFLYSSIGGGYMELYMGDKASEYQLKAIELYRKVNDLEEVCRRMGSLASTYRISGHNEKAIEMHNRVIKMADGLKLSDSKSFALTTLGQIYEDSDPRESIRCYYEALKINEQDHNLTLYYTTLFNMALFFLKDTLNLYGKEIGDNRKSADIVLAYLDEHMSWSREMQGQLSMKEHELAKNRVITYLFIGISALILILAGVVFYFLRQKQKTARLLKNENATIPVIALTASVIRTDVRHCLESGMNGYVPKPISISFLAKTIHDHLKAVVEKGAVR